MLGGTALDRSLLVGATLGVVYVGYLLYEASSVTQQPIVAASDRAEKSTAKQKPSSNTLLQNTGEPASKHKPSSAANVGPAEELTAETKHNRELAKEWLKTYATCYKISPGRATQLENKQMTTMKMYMADTKRHAAIISVKGWGGGMTKEDFMAHLGVYPGEEGQTSPTPKAEFIEAAAKEAAHLLGESGLFDMLAASQQKIFIQWEADEIWDASNGFSTFAVYIYGVARALQTSKFATRFGGFIAQKLDNKKDKVTKRAIVPLDKAEKIRSQKGVQALADFFSLPIYLEVHPSFGAAGIHVEEDGEKAVEDGKKATEDGEKAVTAMAAGAANIASIQKNTNFGFWGHAAHCQFRGVKTIIAYGGGGCLPAEELQGYSRDTKVIGVKVTRRAGKETSSFAEGHAICDGENSPVFLVD
jgi:hypothetical protein